MRSLFIKTVVLFFLAAASCLANTEDQAILIVGDSISAGYGVEADRTWVALLRNRLIAEGYGYRVINASISGDTTSGGLRRLPRALEQHEPGIVLIELGGNDGLRGTPIEVIRDNLAAMIELCQTNGTYVLLAGMQMPPNYGSAYADAFSDLYEGLAKEHGVLLIEYFIEKVALNPTMMQDDGIHPNADGQPQLLDNVWAVLENLLETREG